MKERNSDMPVMSNLCVYADVDNSLLSETKTFNTYSPTDGFEYPYPQYMSAIFLLRTCYDLLVQAGFKDIAKDEGEQSLTIWGLKLFFVNICFSSIGFAVFSNKIGSKSYLNMSSNTCTNGFKQDISRTFLCWEHKNTSNIIMFAVITL
jgi:hypothetical protein